IRCRVSRRSSAIFLCFSLRARALPRSLKQSARSPSPKCRTSRPSTCSAGGRSPLASIRCWCASRSRAAKPPSPKRSFPASLTGSSPRSSSSSAPPCARNRGSQRIALVHRRGRRQNGQHWVGRGTVAKGIKVEIYDQSYTIGGGVEEDYVTDLARYVDTKMREVAEASKTVDSLRVAVLAALAIADELYTLRKGQEELTGSLRERATRCLTLVERALKQSA